MDNNNLKNEQQCAIHDVSGSLLDKSLLFKRAWVTYKIKKKCKCDTTLGKEIANCYRIAKLIGYENYKPCGYELNYR